MAFVDHVVPKGIGNPENGHPSRSMTLVRDEIAVMPIRTKRVDIGR